MTQCCCPVVAMAFELQDTFFRSAVRLVIPAGTFKYVVHNNKRYIYIYIRHTATRVTRSCRTCLKARGQFQQPL